MVKDNIKKILTLLGKLYIRMKLKNLVNIISDEPIEDKVIKVPKKNQNK